VFNSFRNGLKESFALIFGYVPVAIAFGIAIRSIGLSTQTGTFMSAIVFAGSSQFALLELIKQKATIFTMVLVCLGLNLRHVLYSFTLAPFLTKLELKKRCLLGFGLTDEVFALSLVRLPCLKKEERFYWMLGIESGAYLFWAGGTYLGAVGGQILVDYLPAIKPGLAFAPTALFFALLIAMLKKEAFLPVSAVILITLVLNRLGLSNWSLPSAALIGPLIGIIGERLWKKYT